ncbi:hypothetical protein [Streptomyces sp. NPDC004284]
MVSPFDELLHPAHEPGAGFVQYRRPALPGLPRHSAELVGFV